MKLDLIAVVPGLGAWNGIVDGRLLKMPDAPELVAQDLGLRPQLQLVRHVLIMAAAAHAEVLAARCDSRRRWLEDLDQLGPGETPALLHDPHAHKLARDTERDEDNPFGLPWCRCRNPAEGVAAVR